MGRQPILLDGGLGCYDANSTQIIYRVKEKPSKPQEVILCRYQVILKFMLNEKTPNSNTTQNSQRTDTADSCGTASISVGGEDQQN